MRKILRVIRISLLGLILFLLCGGFYVYITDTDIPQLQQILPFEEPEYSLYFPDDSNVRALGRTHYENGVRYLSHSGSGIEFICKGRYATIRLTDDSGGRYSASHRPRFAVYKNGQLIIDQVLTKQEETLYIDIGDNTEEVTVRVMKLSEAQYSALCIEEIGVYGSVKIKPTREKNLKIEFIGDSITCGYGIDEGRSSAGFSTATENFSKTYAYMTAENLNADFSAVCFSGYGVLSGFTSDGRINSEDVVSRYYDKSCFLYAGRETFWDFSEFQSDIVVINLGTNDASYCSKSYEGRQEFTRKYAELIRLVRSYNPSAYILCILGDMNNSLYSCIDQAVSNYINESYDLKVEAMTVEYRMDINDIVIDGHPGYLANVCASEMLTAKLREKIW